MPNSAEQGLITIDLQNPLESLRIHGASATPLPEEAGPFKAAMRAHYLGEGSPYVELHGGHRNMILKDTRNDEITIVWRVHQIRWKDIMIAALTEHVAATELGIPGRQLVDPSVPVEISEDGHYVSRMRWVPGEGRYPWVQPEIESAAQLLKRLHDGLRRITFDPVHGHTVDEGEDQWIHGDAARANILFTAHTADASAVIDYENIQSGPREQDIARTATLLLVDTQLRREDGLLYVPHTWNSHLEEEFDHRMSALIDSYPTPVHMNPDLIVAYMGGYLASEDYGGLNHIAHWALEFINKKYPKVKMIIPNTF